MRKFSVDSVGKYKLYKFFFKKGIEQNKFYRVLTYSTRNKGILKIHERIKDKQLLYTISFLL